MGIGCALPLAFDHYPPAEHNDDSPAGDNQHVIVLHGLFGAGGNWRSIARRLNTTRHVWVADARNHGRSPWHNDMNYSLMAADTARFMSDNVASLAHGTRVMIGHSMGGKTAMSLALRQPQIIDKLVIVDIAPKSYPQTHLDVLSAMRELDLGAIASRAQADAQLAVSIGDDAIRRFVLQNLVRGQQRETATRYAWRVNLAAIAANLPAISGWAVDAHATFDKPTLFIRGNRSTYIEDRDAELVKRYFPQARVATIHQAGHWPHVENADAFMANLNAFL